MEKQIFEIKIKACVRSGFCCKQTPCGYGQWNEKRTQCEFLGGEKPGEYFCKKFEEIQKDPASYWSPAFGAGCCSSLNTDRAALIKKLGREVFVDSKD